MGKCIYTVVFNKYDSLKPPKVVMEGFDYICFTEDKDLVVDGWEMVIIEDNSVKHQRKIKICPHLYLSKYDLWVYHDANIEVKKDISPIVDKLSNYNMLTISHPSRDNLIDEGNAIVGLNKASLHDVRNQINQYKYRGVDLENSGMWATGFIVRRNTSSTIEFMDKWWAEVKKYTQRDQLGLPVVARGYTVYGITWSQFLNFFEYKKHSPYGANIVYSNPFDTNKNIGRAYNKFIENQPDDCWIILQDGDIMYLTDNWGVKIRDIIHKNGSDYELIGCTTNRIFGKHQLHEGKFSNDFDIRNHVKIAEERWNKYGSEVEPTSGVAGFFMAFRKSTWKKVGGFKEGTHTADTHFNKAIKKHGGKIGLATGLYVFHNYRTNQIERQSAKNDLLHLINICE